MPPSDATPSAESVPETFALSRADALAALDDAALELEIAKLAEAGGVAGPLLARLGDIAPSRTARKSARAALHRLRASGARIAVPRVALAIAAPTSSAEPHLAIASLPDAAGQQVLVLAQRGHDRAFTFFARLSDRMGVLLVQAKEGSWRDARPALRHIAEGASPEAPMAWLPFGEVAALVRRAERLRSALPEGVDVDVLQHMLHHAGPRMPGERVREQLGARAAELSLEEAQATLALGQDSSEAASFRVLGGTEFLALAQELDEIERGPLVLSPAQVRERETERVAAFAASFFGESTRRRLSERFEECAAVWQALGTEKAACASLRLASFVLEAPSPLELSGIRASFDRTLDLARRRVDEVRKLAERPESRETTE